MHGELRTDRCPRIVNRFSQLECKYVSNIVTAGLNRRLSSLAARRRRSTNLAVGNWMRDPTETKNTKNRDIIAVLGDLLRDLPAWSEDFTENQEDEGVSASTTPESTSRESDSERRTKVVSRKHSIFTHFPEDRDCEVCKRAKFTRAPRKKRTGTAVLRAEKFGDLMTADHKCLSEGCPSRNNNRYAVVVQDLATQWIQSYPCKTKTSQRKPNAPNSHQRNPNAPKIEDRPQEETEWQERCAREAAWKLAKSVLKI